MNRKHFLEMMDRVFEKIRELNERKGHDYAGDEDPFSNFKERAIDLGLSKEQIWAVYACKHWDAIMTFCKEGQVASEPIEGRLEDVILYCLLLMGMIETDQHELEKGGMHA
jgi:hypothetical protein